MNKNNEILSLVTEEEQQHAHQDFIKSLIEILDSNQSGFFMSKCTHKQIEFNLNSLVIAISNKDSCYYTVSISVYYDCNSSLVNLVNSLLKTLNSNYSDFIKKNGDDFFFSINEKFEFDSFCNSFICAPKEFEFDDTKNNDIPFSIFKYNDNYLNVISISSYREQVLKIINSLIIK